MTSSPKPILEWLRLEGNDTSDIFFGCLAAIVASTFLALHLNVPGPHQKSTSKFFLRRWWALGVVRQLRRQLAWAAIAVVVPEILGSLSFAHWRATSLGLRTFREFGRGNVNRWTKAHASFANMGGFKFIMRKGGEEIPDELSFADRDRPVLVRIAQEGLERTAVQDLSKLLRDYLTSTWLWARGLLRPISALLYTLGRFLPQRYFNPGRSGSARDSPVDANGQSGEDAIELQPTTPTEAALAQQELAEGDESSAEPPSHRPASIDLGDPDRSVADSQNVAPTNLPNGDTSRFDDESVPFLASGTEHDEEQGSTITLYLNANQIVVAQVLGILDEGPHITVEEIEDKGKSNVFVKGFAALQLLWFATRAVVQICRGQSLTHLELATFTYVLCAVTAYMLYWSKPQAVELPIEWSVRPSATVRPITDEDIRWLRLFGGTRFLSRNFLPPFGMDGKGHDPFKPIPTDISLSIFVIYGPKDRAVVYFDDDFAGVIIGMVFGALYCMGWNYPFPSRWELWAWRLASVIITASLVPYSLVNAYCTMRFAHLYHAGTPGKTHVVHILSLYALLGLYTGCRVFMLVEMVRTLFAT